MKRRSVLRNLTIGIGGSLVISPTLFSSCQSPNYQPLFFTKKDLLLLNEIGETILPETVDSPGAKTLNVANFMDLYAADCYKAKQQKVIQEGLLLFEKECLAKIGASFLKITAQQRQECLVDLDEKAKNSKTPHYFTELKSLVLLSYFTSKDGATKALRYLPIPGKFEGNHPIQQGDKAWALG